MGSTRHKPPRATPAAFLFRIVALPWEMAVVEDFLQVSCENRGTRIVMTGKQVPAPAIIQGYS
jgi:hypothetical protein